MFTGIIESLGRITSITHNQANITFGVQSNLASQCKIDQSVAHNGVCLTIVGIQNDVHFVTAIAETLQKTNLGDWKVDSLINLERAMQANARLDGHFVQGHADATAICTNVQEQAGSWLYTFSFAEKFAALVIEKGSICINGISLTCFNVSKNSLQVAIIPYTYQHTNLKEVAVNHLVNIEFDMIGKYLARHISLQQ
jgi:riboflavin synthase